MFKINDYIVYNKDICKIERILEKYYNDEDYYELKSVSDNSLSLKIPVSSKKIRTIITKESDCHCNNRYGCLGSILCFLA